MEESRKHFAKKLSTMLLDKGWNQSELARRAGIGRDNVSGYVRGRNLPNSQHLDKMARALNVDASELIGRGFYTRHPAGLRDVPLKIEQVEGEPGHVHLYVNQRVTMEVATQIMALLKNNRRSAST